MDAGSGYSSDPTTSTSSRDFGRNIKDEEIHHDQHDHIPSFSSLHNRAHLQSTPAKTARLPLHRVDRAANPAFIVQSSASESQSQTEEEEEEGEGEMEDNATELGGPRGAGGQTGSAAGTRVREYWGRLLQEAEESKANAESHLGVPATRRQPPSTGSSTLVDQESLTGKAASSSRRISSSSQTTLERPASAPPVTYDSTPISSRPSPLQDHISRFISSTPSDPYIPARPPSPPSLSHHDDLSRNSSHNNNNSSSAIASRVHDIFAKHIHSASTSSTARQPIASRNTERHLPPRQRLRDLLGESNPSNSRHPHTRTPSSQQTYTSESEGESIQEPQRPYRNSSATARTSPKRRREGSNTPKAGPSQRLISKLPNSSASTSRSRLDPAEESRSHNKSQERRVYNDAYDTSANRSRQHTTRPSHSRRISGSFAEPELRPESPARRESRNNTSQLSREWDSIRQQEQSRQYEEALEHIQGNSQDEEEQLDDQQSEGEYRSSEVEDEARQVQMHSQSDSDPGYSPESELEPPQRPEVNTSRARERDFGPEEEASPLSQSEQGDERHVSYVQQQRISPRLGTLSSFRRSTNGDTSGLHDEALPSEVVQVATSTPRAASRTINRSFGNSTRAPKTPHPPGAYFSTTPSATFIGGSPSRRKNEDDSFVERRGNETAEASRSRFLGTANYSVASKIPGGYSSPFPQPRKSGLQGDERDTVRFSTPSKSRQSMLAPSSASPSRTDSRIREVDNDGSPARQRRSPRSEAKLSSPRNANNSLKAAASPSTPKKGHLSPQGTPRSQIGSGDTTLQSMFTDLVKPLKNLLVGFHTPPKPTGKAISITPKVKEEEENLLENEDTLVERKKRRLEHDHILARLSEADRIDRSLASRIDEMRKAVDEMGQRLSSQVSSVISESFVQEAKRRKLWFSLLIFGQLLLLYLIFIYANARANQLYQTTYFDPFFPVLLDPAYHESRLSSSSLFRTSYPLSSSSSSSSSGAQNDNNEKSWHTFLRVFQYALYAIRDNIGLGGGRTDFVHGTFEHAVTRAVTAAAASDTTAVFRIPT